MTSITRELLISHRFLTTRRVNGMSVFPYRGKPIVKSETLIGPGFQTSPGNGPPPRFPLPHPVSPIRQCITRRSSCNEPKRNEIRIRHGVFIDRLVPVVKGTRLPDPICNRQPNAKIAPRCSNGLPEAVRRHRAEKFSAQWSY